MTGRRSAATALPPTPEILADRLARRLSVGTAEGCWLWSGTLDTEGYGWFRYEGKNYKVHRVSYELHVGPIADGLVIDHLCRVRRCVNPQHLEPVTSAENACRAHAIGYFGNPATCKRGHDWAASPPYTYPLADGRISRRCRECQKESSRAVRRRAKERKAAA